ncbi:MAG: phage terminase large subunit [Candidatus Berkelbacteria bacterium]
MENTSTTKNAVSDNELNRVLNDPILRKELAKEDHYWFFNLYLSHYVHCKTAPFQREIFDLTTDEKIQLAIIIAFRGSGKSTIVSLSYPIWAIIGKQQKKFVVLLSQTQHQARMLLVNIKRELEGNEMLRKELGPFQEESDEWGSTTLVIPGRNARITAASTEQSIRGIRHGHSRPDLIIADDIEDIASTKTKEGRDKCFNWLMGEVIPAGDKNTKTVMIGNLLHEDSVLMRLKAGIEQNSIDGVFKQYPLINKQGEVVWPGKYPTEADIEKEKRKNLSASAFQREFMLEIIPDVEQIIHQEWIKFYDQPPEDTEEMHHVKTCCGVDLAISNKDTADYTAAVSAKVYGSGDKQKIYILPHLVNQRLTFRETVDTLKNLPSIINDGKFVNFYIEKVGYQDSLVQQLMHEGVKVKGADIHGEDKTARLNRVSAKVFNGQILFPRQGVEKLIQQLVHFGVEKHDDLTDAFTLLIIQIMNKNTGGGGTFIMMPNFFKDIMPADGRMFTAGLMDKKF